MVTFLICKIAQKNLRKKTNIIGLQNIFMENIYKQEVLFMKAAVCQTEVRMVKNVNVSRHKPLGRFCLLF